MAPGEGSKLGHVGLGLAAKFLVFQKILRYTDVLFLILLEMIILVDSDVAQGG